MKVVAYTELAILARVVFGTVTFSNSLLAPIIFAHFLRQRYFQSAFTRDAVAYANAYISNLVGRPGVPPVVGTVWDKVQMLVQRWAGIVLTQPANNAPPAGAARR